MKRLLILGAGFLQSFVIKKANELGYYTIAIDKNPNSIGFQYANEYEIVDIVDSEACLEYARLKAIDGVMTAATDYGVISAAYVAKQLRLSGLNFDTAMFVKNKYEVRKLFARNNIDEINQYYEVMRINDVESLKNEIEYPVIVKPCDGSGSKSICRVDNEYELKAACVDAIEASLLSRAIIEDFIVGEEYGVESFVYAGEIYVLGIMKKKMTLPPDYAELGHAIPSGLLIEEKIKKIVQKAIGVLGVDFGAVNMDLLVTSNDNVYIIDVGARMGGNLIGSHIIKESTDYDYLGNLIRATMGDKVELPSTEVVKKVATRIIALSPGKIKSLPDIKSIIQENNVQVFFNKRYGDYIQEYHNNLNGCGYIISTSTELGDAENRVTKSLRMLDESIIRED